MDCSYSEYSNNMKIIKLVTSPVLIVHPSKSIFFPCQEIEYLGFFISSIKVTFTLTIVKKHKIILLCDEILSCCPTSKIVLKVFANKQDKYIKN